MAYGKAVEEVWKWREVFEKELEKVPDTEQVKYINDTAKKACKRLGIKCRKVLSKTR